MRIVLDTNVLVSGVFWAGQPLRVLELWADDRVQVVASESILLEYAAVLKEIGAVGVSWSWPRNGCLSSFSMPP